MPRPDAGPTFTQVILTFTVNSHIMSKLCTASSRCRKVEDTREMDLTRQHWKAADWPRFFDEVTHRVYSMHRRAVSARLRDAMESKVAFIVADDALFGSRVSRARSERRARRVFFPAT